MSDTINKNDGLYYCDICNKNYLSYKSLWKHTKNIHKNNLINFNKSANCLNNNKTYICRYCNKNFTNVKTRWSHEKKCIIKYNNNKNELNKIKLELLKKKNTTNEIEVKTRK